MKLNPAGALTIALTGIMIAQPAYAAQAPVEGNAFSKQVFVANAENYLPTLNVVPKFVNAWGLAIRPKGAGGHFWVTAKDVSYEYVGDVRASSDEKLRPLHQDSLKMVKLPIGGKDNFATATVFSDSKDAFVITQKIEGKEDITAPAKFLFASDGGIISAWTERKLPDGTFDRAPYANQVIDHSAEGAQYFGLTMSHDYSRLYAANFGKHTGSGIEVFGGDFKPLDVTFDQPFDDNKNAQVDPGEYAPFNVQALTTPSGEHHVFVAYAKTQACPKAAIKKGECKRGEMYVGEEDTDTPGQGRLAEFTEEGRLVSVWKDGGMLSAPWGMAFAPANYGKFSNSLLVGNFGDGTIAAFDPETQGFVDRVKDTKGKPIIIEKLWAILFGNGESLGDADALYFAAGPRDEKDGIFGVLRPVK